MRVSAPLAPQYFKLRKMVLTWILFGVNKKITFWLRQELKEWHCPSFCPSLKSKVVLSLQSSLSGLIFQVVLSQTYTWTDRAKKTSSCFFIGWPFYFSTRPASLFSLISKIFQGFAFLIPFVSGFQEPRDWLRLKDEATQHKLQNDGHRKEQNHNTFGN